MASQSQISSFDRASQLLFYLASDDVTMGRGQLKAIMDRTDTAVSSLYKRLYNKKMEGVLKAQRLRKEGADEPRVFVFKAWEVRDAALEEFLALGDEAIPVLRRSIHSARQDLTLGVLRTLRKLNAKDILPILSDVLERRPDGQTRFSKRVRREAILGLRNQNPSEERWRKLLAENVVDLDAGARSLAQETVALAVKHAPEWANQQLERGLVHELSLIEKYRKKADTWGNRQAFEDDPSRFSSILHTLEVILQYAPTVYPDPFPELLESSDSVLRLSLKYHNKLSDEIRAEILNMAFSGDNSIVILDALRALEERDRKAFSTKVLDKLMLKTDPAVLSESIRLSGVWDLKESKASLKLIATQARRPGVKSLAEETLKNL